MHGIDNQAVSVFLCVLYSVCGIQKTSPTWLSIAGRYNNFCSYNDFFILFSLDRRLKARDYTRAWRSIFSGICLLICVKSHHVNRAFGVLSGVVGKFQVRRKRCGFDARGKTNNLRISILLYSYCRIFIFLFGNKLICILILGYTYCSTKHGTCGFWWPHSEFGLLSPLSYIQWVT